MGRLGGKLLGHAGLARPSPRASRGARRAPRSAAPRPRPGPTRRRSEPHLGVQRQAPEPPARCAQRHAMRRSGSARLHWRAAAAAADFRTQQVVRDAGQRLPPAVLVVAVGVPLARGGLGPADRRPWPAEGVHARRAAPVVRAALPLRLLSRGRGGLHLFPGPVRKKWGHGPSPNGFFFLVARGHTLTAPHGSSQSTASATTTTTGAGRQLSPEPQRQPPERRTFVPSKSNTTTPTSA